MKSLYIVDYWVPFPASEYGGVINLIAENDTEAFELLANEDQFDEAYTDRIMERVVNAQKFSLVDEYESGILDAFITWSYGKTLPHRRTLHLWLGIDWSKAR